ncbi:hypothetical protein L1887_32043 [Cichorium endivia]|nr:hypothetical protein L1887_32043 [Cichorium endivia]
MDVEDCEWLPMDVNGGNRWRRLGLGLMWPMDVNSANRRRRLRLGLTCLRYQDKLAHQKTLSLTGKMYSYSTPQKLPTGHWEPLSDPGLRALSGQYSQGQLSDPGPDRSGKYPWETDPAPLQNVFGPRSPPQWEHNLLSDAQTKCEPENIEMRPFS